ncbi:hypothetical protein C7M84_000909, partial [Penaeus vannamei]
RKATAGERGNGGRRLRKQEVCLVSRSGEEAWQVPPPPHDRFNPPPSPFFIPSFLALSLLSSLPSSFLPTSALSSSLLPFIYPHSSFPHSSPFSLSSSLLPTFSLLLLSSHFSISPSPLPFFSPLLPSLLPHPHPSSPSSLLFSFLPSLPLSSFLPLLPSLPFPFPSSFPLLPFFPPLLFPSPPLLLPHFPLPFLPCSLPSLLPFSSPPISPSLFRSSFWVTEEEVSIFNPSPLSLSLSSPPLSPPSTSPFLPPLHPLSSPFSYPFHPFPFRTPCLNPPPLHPSPFHPPIPHPLEEKVEENHPHGHIPKACDRRVFLLHSRLSALGRSAERSSDILTGTTLATSLCGRPSLAVGQGRPWHPDGLALFGPRQGELATKATPFETVGQAAISGCLSRGGFFSPPALTN